MWVGYGGGQAVDKTQAHAGRDVRTHLDVEGVEHVDELLLALADGGELGAVAVRVPLEQRVGAGAVPLDLALHLYTCVCVFVGAVSMGEPSVWGHTRQKHANHQRQKHTQRTVMKSP